MQVLIGMLSLALIVPAALWQAFVLVMLWGWFVQPTFGMPAPGYAAAIGLTLIVRYLTHQAPPLKEQVAAIDGDEEHEVTWKMLYVAASNEFFVPFWALLAGWVVSAWV